MLLGFGVSMSEEYYKYEVTGIFKGWRKDKSTIKAKNMTEARRKFLDRYGKKYRTKVTDIKVRYLGAI